MDGNIRKPLKITTTNRKIGSINLELTVDILKTWKNIFQTERQIKAQLETEYKNIDVLTRYTYLHVGRKRLEWGDRVIESINRMRIGVRQPGIHVNLRVAKMHRRGKQQMDREGMRSNTNTRAATTEHQAGPSNALRRPLRNTVKQDINFENEWENEEVYLNQHFANGQVGNPRDGVVENGGDNADPLARYDFPASVDSVNGDAEDDLKEKIMEKFLDFTNGDFLYGLRGFREFTAPAAKMRNTVKHPYLMAFLSKVFDGV